MKKIAEHYLSKVITSPFYNSPNPVKDFSILFPEFRDKLSTSIYKFHQKYLDVEIVFVETYRSNILQLQHYNNGASQIKKNGMHHYAIATDIAFKINGKFTYNGDYKFLRQCHEEAGLYLLGLWDIGHVQGIPVSKQGELRKIVDSVICDFQKANGLVVDGIVGKKTIAKAKGVFA